MDLFFRDNHASNINTTHQADAKSSEFVRELLGRYYPDHFCSSVKIEIVSGVNLNSMNYKVGDLFFKTLTHAQGKGRVHFFPELVEALGQKKLPAISFIRNCHNEFITTVESGSEKFYCTLQPFVEGQFYPGTKDAFACMLDAIDSIATAFENVASRRPHQIPYAKWDPRGELDTVLSVLKAKDHDEFDTQLKPALSKCEQIVSFYESIKGDLSIECLHHYDLHPHNLLFNNDKLAAILDLDNIGAIDRRIATGFNLFKVGRKAISTKNITVEQFKTLAGQNFDLSSLKNFALIELFQRFTLLFKAHYTDKSSAWDPDLKKYLCALEEIEAMF